MRDLDPTSDGALMIANLNDTSRCPLGVRCESCGLEAGADLAVYASECAVGVMCLTMCPRCGKATGDVNIAVSTANRLAIQHAGHFGVTIKDMQILQTASGRLSWQQARNRWVGP